MTHQELFALMERFEKSGIGELCYRQGDERVLLRKNAVVQAAAMPTTTAAAPVVTTPLAASPSPVAVEGRLITAPLVGSFYASPSPDAPPFVTVGKSVKKGETVAVLEAMKMINEVPAPCDCVIEEILVESGALVGFAQPLLRVREI